MVQTSKKTRVFRKDKEKDEVKKIVKDINNVYSEIEANRLEIELAKHWLEVFPQNGG